MNFFDKNRVFKMKANFSKSLTKLIISQLYQRYIKYSLDLTVKQGRI